MRNDNSRVRIKGLGGGKLCGVWQDEGVNNVVPDSVLSKGGVRCQIGSYRTTGAITMSWAGSVGWMRWFAWTKALLRFVIITRFLAGVYNCVIANKGGGC